MVLLMDPGLPQSCGRQRPRRRFWRPLTRPRPQNTARSACPGWSRPRRRPGSRAAQAQAQGLPDPGSHRLPHGHRPHLYGRRGAGKRPARSWACLNGRDQQLGRRQNVLTADEIAAADGIIIARDKNVDTARFHGKPVLLFVPVSDGIHKPAELIQQIESGAVPVYRKRGRAAAAAPQ